MKFVGAFVKLTICWICITIFLQFACVVSVSAQSIYTDSKQNWSKLTTVKFEISEDDFGDIYIPVFDDNILKMHGKVVTLKGYIIPFDGMFSPAHIMLSQMPVASCFFCGGAGPETVAEVYLSNPIAYTPDPVTVVGTLELNAKNDEQLMYILKNATLQHN